MKRILVLCGVAAWPLCAQLPKGSLLVIETEHHTQYVRDVFDNSLLAKQPGPTTSTAASAFGQSVVIGDIIFRKRQAGERLRDRTGQRFELEAGPTARPSHRRH